MKIRKAVISAAGQGTRMLELTKDKSKHLIEVIDRPFLAYLLDNILKAGYEEIVMVVGFREDMVREFLKNYRFNNKKPNIKLVNQFKILGSKEKEYGTACPIRCVKDLMKKENFISICGDNYYSVEDLKGMNINDDYTYVGGLESEHPERYGVLVGDNGYLKEIVEKPKEFVGSLINTSLYKFTPAILEKVFEIEKSPRGEYEITDAISLLAKEKKVKIKKMAGFWMDFGQPDDIQKFAEFLKSESHRKVSTSIN